ncbi:MAG: hypothetical protein RMA76_26985 [Deltaproteobacteria bacterium]|jgi:preprotein translocase subunit SecA
MGHDVSRLKSARSIPVSSATGEAPANASKVLQMPDAPVSRPRHVGCSTDPSSPNGVIGVRGKNRGTLNGSRALRALTGLEGHISRRDLVALGAVRTKQSALAGLSEAQLQSRFAELKSFVRGDRKRMEKVLPELIAVATTVARKTLSLPARDEQIVAAIAMVRGSAVELSTGEGKSLAVGLAAAALATEGKGVHVMTANHYLADRDSGQMRALFDGLGLTVGLVADDQGPQRYENKRVAYAADVTYGAVSTMAFDWLEDQTWWRKESRVMRGQPSALVDELDHILLDTAVEPLVLSRFPTEHETIDPVDESLLKTAKQIIDALDADDVTVYLEGDIPRPQLSESGLEKMEHAARDVLGLTGGECIWEEQHTELLAELRLALEARFSVRPGRDYIKQDGDIVLVSQSTGRPNPAARLRHGLHNAVRVREGLPPENNAVPIAMGSYHHFLRAYDYMTGTTATVHGARQELRELHGLTITRIPTHRENKREDLPDRIFSHPAVRDAAAIADLFKRNADGQPVLISTVSVEASKRIANLTRDPLAALAAAACSSSKLMAIAGELIDDADELLGRPEARGDDELRSTLSHSLAERMREDRAGTSKFVAFLAKQGLDLSVLLDRSEGLAPQVLNAENHAAEADIIGSAGGKGAVIIATQMAGRGAHIHVPDEVLELGGLHVIGVERKESRRLDLQVIGRSGRCGEIGSSQFFVSPADAFLTHLAASDRRALARRLSGDEPELTNGVRRFFFSRTVKRAQEHAEMRAASIRYTTAPLDESLEHQRAAVQKFRNETIEHADPLDLVLGWVRELAIDDEARVRTMFGLGDARGDVAALIRARVEAHDAANGTSSEASADFVRDMILSHVDVWWLAQLHEHESLRSTAFMRTRMNTWADHTFDTAEAFAEMCLQFQDQTLEQLAFHLTGVA